MRVGDSRQVETRVPCEQQLAVLRERGELGRVQRQPERRRPCGEDGEIIGWRCRGRHRALAQLTRLRLLLRESTTRYSPEASGPRKKARPSFTPPIWLT